MKEKLYYAKFTKEWLRSHPHEIETVLEARKKKSSKDTVAARKIGRKAFSYYYASFIEISSVESTSLLGAREGGGK